MSDADSSIFSDKRDESPQIPSNEEFFRVFSGFLSRQRRVHANREDRQGRNSVAKCRRRGPQGTATQEFPQPLQEP
jgi:hypothetical protein